MRYLYSEMDVQPRAVVERNELRLRSFGFEIHDDVLC